MRYQPARAASDGRAPSLLRLPKRLRAALIIVASAAIGLVPVVFVSTPAQAAAGQVTIDSDLEANESDAFVFDVRRERLAVSAVTLDIAVTGTGVHPATPGDDFVIPTVTSTTFQPSNNNVLKKITVQGKADALDEWDETFTLTLTDHDTHAFVASANGVLDDQNAAPTYHLSVNKTPVPEADHTAGVTATLDGGVATGRDIDIPFDTQDGSASSVAGEDYTAVASGHITIAADDSSGYVGISITNDHADDRDIEDFLVIAPAGDNGQTNSAGNLTVQIADDDATPTISVGNAGNVTEGGSLSFPLTLTAASHLPITVLASTSDGTALAASDYTAFAIQLVTFAPGDTTKSVPVTTTNDSVNEVDPETVRLTLSSPTNVLAGTMTALGDINDTPDTAPGLTLDPTSVTEGDVGSVEQTFNVHLNADSGRTIRVGYQVNTVTAGAADFELVDQASPGVLTFAPGQRLKTFKVKVFGDTIHEGDETFNVVLSDLDNLLATGGLTAGGGLGTNAVTITDDDAVPVLQTIPAVSHAEGNAAGSLNMRVSISNPDKNQITLNVVANPGTATAANGSPGGNDYSLPSATATIAAGATYVDIPITINGDIVYEGDESATIAVDSTDVTGDPQSGTFTLTDDDPVPTVVLSSRSAVEGTTIAVDATVTGIAQRAIPITLSAVGFSTGGSSPATLTDDFDPTLLNVMLIPGGDQTVNPVSLGTIAALDDLIDEPDQTVKVTLTSGVLATASALQTIVDASTDLPPAVAIGDASVNEDAGTMDVPVTISFNTSGNTATSTEQPVVVHYKTMDGTATAPDDYTGTTDSAVTVAPGTSSTVIHIPIADDSLYELDETLQVVVLSVAPTGASVDDGTGTETILANDSGNRPTFLVGNVSHAEDATGTADITVTLSRVSSQAVHFDVATRDGTAVNATGGPGADDYDAPATTLTIPGNTLTGVIHVPVNHDLVYEGDETVNVDVALAQSETGAIGSLTTGTVTITNDDAVPTLALTGSNVPEGASFDVTATVTGVAQADIHYDLTLSGAGTSPAQTADYTDSGVQGVLTGGTASGSQVTLRSVPITADLIDEPNQGLKVDVKNGGTQTVIATATYTILDDPNDLPPSASINDVTVSEGVGSHADLTVHLAFVNGTATSTEQPVTVTYTTEDVTALAGSDYTAPAGGATVPFPAGTVDQTISVPIANDGVFERAETFNVKLTAIVPTGATIVDDTGVVTIAESNVDAKPTWSLGADQRVLENVTGGAAVFALDLSGPSSVPVTFTAGMTNGTAVDLGTNPGSNDFNPPTASLTIAAGQTHGTFRIPINPDSVYEADEDATLSVALAQGEDGASGTAQTRTLTIANDDAKPTITLNQSVAQAEGTTIDIQATQHGQAQAAMTFDLTFAGDATGGNDPAETGDYTAGQVRATIPAGTADGVMTSLGTIVLNNDTIDEPVEAIAVSATDILGVIDRATTVYKINDDPLDLPPSISIGDVAVNENVGNASVPVTLTFDVGNANATEQITVLHYRTTDVTATAGSDYTGTTTGVLPIPAGAGTATGAILVPITVDGIYERAETFTVGLTSHDPAEAVVNRGTATVTINRNDTSAMPSFTVADKSQNEDAGVANFVITLNHAGTQPVSFTANLSPGTATTGGSTPGSNDYTYTPVPVTIAAGQTTATVPVTVIADTVYETDENATMVVALASGEDNASGGPVNATLTILNDDATPRITLNSGESGTEGADIVVIGRADRVAQAALTFDLAFTGDGTGNNVPASSADYVDSGAQVTIPAGTAADTPITFRTFRLANDKIDEPVETIKVTASDHAGNLANATGLYLINDDPSDLPPTVSVDDKTVSEGDGSAMVDVHLVFDPAITDATSTTRPVTVNYTTADGTALAGSDYTATTNSVTFQPGSSGGQVAVPILNDLRDESTEAFTLKVTSATPTDVRVTRDTGTVTILDDDAGVAKPTFSVADVSQPEGNSAGYAEFTVELHGAAQDDVSFTVGIADGTAVDVGAGVGSNDYNPPAAATLVIAYGRSSGTVRVPVNGDTVFEGNETAALTVGLATGERDATGSPVNALLTLTNDDALPTVMLTNKSGTEGDGLAVSGTVSGSTQNDAPIDVVFSGDAIAPNIAASEDDFDTSQVNAVIPAGSTTGSQIGLGTVTLNNDAVDELTETIKVVTGGHPTYYRILDDPNDLPPTVSIGDKTVSEGAGAAEVDVHLVFDSATNDATSTTRPVTVNYTTADGTALAGSDYTATTGSVTFDPGSAGGPVAVPIVDDLRDEPTEAFTVKATSATPADVMVTHDTGTVTILDDDVAVLKPTFSIEDVTQPEGNSAGYAEFTVELHGTAQDDVSFTVGIADGTAVDVGTGVGSNDYNPPASTTLVILSGRSSGTIRVPVNGDTVYEGDETAMLTVGLAAGELDATGNPVNAALTLTNDDALPTVTLTNKSGTEGDGLAVSGTVSGSTQSDAPIDIEFTGDATAPNIAASDDDFDTSQINAVIPAGSTTGAQVGLGTVTLNNDTVDELTETIKVVTGGHPAYYRILDDPNDQPPSVSIDDVSLNEGDGPAQVDVHLAFDPATNDATSTTRPVTVNYTTVNGTALAGSDYTATTDSVTFDPGSTGGPIAIPIADDLRDEPTEAFTVKLTSVSPTDARIAADTGTVTILDDDAAAPKPTFTVADVTQAEGNAAGYATFTVTLSEAAQGDVSFTTAVADDTAVDVGTGVGSNDYNPPAATLLITQGQTSGTIRVPVNGDTVYEGDETAVLTVGLADGERNATGDPVDATLTLENDDAVPTVALTNKSGTEGDELSVSGTVTGSTQDDVEIDLAFSGDATAPNIAAGDEDYDTSQVSPFIPAGSTTGAQVGLGTVTLVADTVDEPTETIKVVTGSRSAYYRILDDPANLPPTVSVSDESIGEAEGSVDVTVSLNFADGTTATGYDVVVPWSTIDGTAKSDADYTAQSDSVTISAGDDSATVSVPINDDSLYEGDQHFLVRLGTPAPSVVKLDDSTADVTILDDEVAAAPILVVPTTNRTGAGRVTVSGTTGEGARVQLFAAPLSAPSSYTVVLTANADSLGRYSFTPSVDIGTNFYTRAYGLNSIRGTVRLVQVPVLTGTSTVKGAVTLTVTGNPRAALQSVQIQRLNTNGTWSNVVAGRLLANGTYVPTVRSLTSGTTYTFRAVIAASPTLGILGGTSGSLRIRVK